MSNAFSLVAGFLCCLLTFFGSCRSEKASPLLASIASDHQNYTQQFTRSVISLQQQLSEVKLLYDQPADSLAMNKITAIDSKVSVYKQRSVQQLTLLMDQTDKFKRGEITESDLQKTHQQFLSEAKQYEDAFNQLESTLARMTSRKSN